MALTQMQRSVTLPFEPHDTINCTFAADGERLHIATDPGTGDFIWASLCQRNRTEWILKCAPLRNNRIGTEVKVSSTPYSAMTRVGQAIWLAITPAVNTELSRTNATLFRQYIRRILEDDRCSRPRVGTVEMWQWNFRR
ncbi:hypothetical protein MMC28_001409 [Mycoblastus sanguinarius]|nr:hypothetical protein [Mycoblastus sanguinarius]